MLVASIAPAESIQGQVRQLIQEANLGETIYAVRIVDLSAAASLAQINVDRPMIPASNMKLLTSAAALDLLQRDFKFQTQLRFIGPQHWRRQAPQLNRDVQRPIDTALLIKGDGDPVLGDPGLLKQHQIEVEDLLQKWVDAVKAAGVERIDRLLVDDRVFDQEWVHGTWPTDQLQYHYCAPVAGINFHANLLHVLPYPTQIGERPRVQLRPAAPFVETSNRAVTEHSDTFWVERAFGSNHFTFWGKIAKRHPPVRVTIYDPPMFCADLLKNRLERAGVRVGPVERVGAADSIPDGDLLYTVQTTLFEVIRRCNSHSQNLCAEALLKRLGAHFTGTPGGWKNGAEAVRYFLQNRLHTNAAKVVIADGSGLSRDNRVTARILVQMLRRMYEDPRIGLDFRQSLSVSGVRGTLKKRFGAGLKNRVAGKTGFIDGVCALSGYVFRPSTSNDSSHSERAVAFSLLFNNVKHPVRIRDIKNVQDRIISLIDQSGRRVASTR